MNQPSENIKSIIHLNRDEYLIRYRLSYACNYHCKDCYQEKDREISVSNNIDDITKKLSLLIENLPTDKPTTLYLEGGEVSLFDIKHLILEKLPLEKISTLKLVTNLSASIEYYDDLLSFCKNHNIKTRWQASFHLEECNPDDFFYKVHNLPIDIVLIVVDNQNYLDYRPYLQQMLNDKIHFTVNPKKYNEKLSDEVIAEINYWEKLTENNFYKVIYFDGSEECVSQQQIYDIFNSLKYGSICNYRKNIAIDPNGNIYFFCSRSKPLGNILEMTEEQIKVVASNMSKNVVCITKHNCSFNCGGIDIFRDDD